MRKNTTIPVVSAVGLLALSLATSVQAISYTGSLSYAGGGIVTDPLPSIWANNSTTFSWTVTDTDTGLQAGWWRYTYEWNATKPPGVSGGDGLSHLIIELSPNITANEYEFGSLSAEVKTHLELQGNPDLPESVYGAKIQTSGTQVVITFDSSRVPVWGDFYAKGGDVYAYNAGFLAADPLVAPANGSIDNHILRPDTVTVGHLPDGGTTLAFLGISMMGVASIRRFLK